MHPKPYLSIIIPVYDGISNGLDKCLDSVWSQPLDPSLYEVICIDDCSKDNTRQWLHEQAEAHPCLRVIENERNVRQGGSRNRGFREARGEYIVLIDQDDYYHDGAIADVYRHLVGSDLDILIVDCAYQSPGRVSNVLQHDFPHREVMTGDEIIAANSIPYAPWKFVIRKRLIIDNDLFFAENERIEDVDWVHRLTHYGERVQYQPILLIHYNKTSSSTTMTSYCTPVTTYSTIRLSGRLCDLADTVFKDSDPKVQNYIRGLGDKFLYLGLRNYLFVNDSAANKREAIITRRNGRYYNALTRFACQHPTVYAHATNLTAPLARLMMRAYRQLKYGKVQD